MTFQEIQATIKQFIVEANAKLPGETGQAKRDYVAQEVLKLVEKEDDLIPIIGKWADLPVVDELEKYLVNIAIERAYAALKIEG